MTSINKDWFVSRDWRLAHGRSLTIGSHSHIMGILNMTPDSFSDGGEFQDVDIAFSHARRMCCEGASIIDVGGESTRPGAEPIDSATERSRILPLIRRLSCDLDILISVDTSHPETADAAIESGAHIINDVWGCRRSPEIADIASRTGCGLVIMHNNRSLDGTATTDTSATAVDILSDQRVIFSESLAILESRNISSSHYVYDPGFGFGKDGSYNLSLLSRLGELHDFGYLGLLIGTSRKRFLSTLTDRPFSECDIATSATSIYSRLSGASLFRVHDCGSTRDALCVADALLIEELKLL